MNQIVTTGTRDVALGATHVRCAVCFKAVGGSSDREAMLRLMEMQGWRIGRDLICPACVEKKMRRALGKLRRDQDEGDRW